jgi:hypothetical protein
MGWKKRKEHQPRGFDALNEVTEDTIHLLCYQLCLWHLEKLQAAALLNPQYQPHSQRLHFSCRLMLAAHPPISSIGFPALQSNACNTVLTPCIRHRLAARVDRAG